MNHAHAVDSTMAPIWERIAAIKHREPNTVTHTRRFERRCRAHGVRIEPVEFRESHAYVRIGRRAIRIDFDGFMTQNAERGDPQTGAIHARLHVHYLALAGGFRARGDVRSARAALRVCQYDRSQSPPLPA